MTKTVTLRLEEKVFEEFREAAAAERRRAEVHDVRP